MTWTVGETYIVPEFKKNKAYYLKITHIDGDAVQFLWWREGKEEWTEFGNTKEDLVKQGIRKLTKLERALK